MQLVGDDDDVVDVSRDIAGAPVRAGGPVAVMPVGGGVNPHGRRGIRAGDVDFDDLVVGRAVLVRHLDRVEQLERFSGGDEVREEHRKVFKLPGNLAVAGPGAVRRDIHVQGLLEDGHRPRRQRLEPGQIQRAHGRIGQHRLLNMHIRIAVGVGDPVRIRQVDIGEIEGAAGRIGRHQRSARGTRAGCEINQLVIGGDDRLVVGADGR